MSYAVNQGQFIFDDVDSQDYGVYITGENAYNAAKKRDEEVIIPGRNGTLTYNEADVFDDVELVYPAFIPRNYAENIRGLRNALSSKHGKKRLTDSYHPDEYMLAKYVDGLDADTAPRAVAGAFDIIFKRDPRRFLLTGDEPVELSPYGGKNLIVNTVSSTTKQGLTYTVNADGSVHVTGTATANSYIAIPVNATYDFETIVSGAPGITGTYIQVVTSAGNKSDTGAGVAIAASVTITEVRLRINNGTTVDTTFYPAIRMADDPNVVDNPTLFAARPLIRVYGYGVVTVGDTVVTVAQNPYAYVDIDSEMMDCYHGDDNANGYVSFSGGEFPVLPAGTTALSYTGSITKVEITPHWWRL